MEQIINYNTGVVYQDSGPLKDRVHFTSSDPLNGDGSIDIINLRESDTGAYQCKVKKLPGSQNMKMRLNVYSKSFQTLIGWQLQYTNYVCFWVDR